LMHRVCLPDLLKLHIFHNIDQCCRAAAWARLILQLFPKSGQVTASLKTGEQENAQENAQSEIKQEEKAQSETKPPIKIVCFREEGLRVAALLAYTVRSNVSIEVITGTTTHTQHFVKNQELLKVANLQIFQQTEHQWLAGQKTLVESNEQYTDVVIVATTDKENCSFSLKDATRARRSFPKARIHLLRNQNQKPRDCDYGFFEHGYTVARISDLEADLSIEYNGLSPWTSSGIYKYQQHYLDKKNTEARSVAALADQSEYDSKQEAK